MTIRQCLVLVALFVTLTRTQTQAAAAQEELQELTDDTFEHLTQATTGATTGDWLIEFYVPWCAHCRSLLPTMEAISEELQPQGINVAKVNCARGGELTCRRMDVKEYPTIIYFRHGKLYKFQEQDRSKEKLMEFVNSIEGLGGATIPGELTLVSHYAAKILGITRTAALDMALVASRYTQTFILTLVTGAISGFLALRMCSRKA